MGRTKPIDKEPERLRDTSVDALGIQALHALKECCPGLLEEPGEQLLRRDTERGRARKGERQGRAFDARFDIRQRALRFEADKSREFSLRETRGLAVLAQTAVVFGHRMLPAHVPKATHAKHDQGLSLAAMKRQPDYGLRDATLYNIM